MTSYSLQNLPPELQETVNTRGFYLYRWISYREYWLAIQRFFLSKMKLIVGIHIILILGMAIFTYNTLLTRPSWYELFMNRIFPIFIISMYALFIAYVAITHTKKYVQSAYIVLTSGYILGFGGATSYEHSFRISPRIEELGDFFREPLFGFSGLSSEKRNMKDLLFENLQRYFLLQMRDKVDIDWTRLFSYFIIWCVVFGIFALSSKPLSALIYSIIMIIVMSAFARPKHETTPEEDFAPIMRVFWYITLIFSFFVYVIGSVVVYFVSAFLFAWANVLIYITKGHEIRIHKAFSVIDNASDRLRGQRDLVCEYLSQMAQKECMDLSLIKMEKALKKIAEEADICISKSKKLKKLLQTLEYGDVFDFTVYDRWLRTEIRIPLQDICLVLQKQYTLLDAGITALIGQIAETPDPQLRAPLEIQKLRLSTQKVLFQENLGILQGYVKELGG